MNNRIIFIYFVLNIFSIMHSSQTHHGPFGMEYNDTTSCDEFSKYARFNPYSVLKSAWMVFYYWGPPQPAFAYWFYVPGEKETAYLKKLVDSNVEKPVNWTAKYVLMRERSNNTSLLVERNDRGEYNLYALYAYKKGVLMKPRDVRIKQTGDNRYIGLMICEVELVYVMAKLRDIPRKNRIQDAVARLGYRGRGGKSYLYQGHQWMPIPEANERLYWEANRLKRWHLYE